LKSANLRLIQHKRFVPYGTHPNSSLSLRTSFMLEPLDEIAIYRTGDQSLFLLQGFLKC
jgi:hypothetical protein